jgi:hypothetical protein
MGIISSAMDGWVLKDDAPGTAEIGSWALRGVSGAMLLGLRSAGTRLPLAS